TFMKIHFRLITMATFVLLTAVTTAQSQTWAIQINNANRFRVLAQFGNAAVLDQETGLVWHRSPSATKLPWSSIQVETAAIYCNVRPVGNRLGWRLPTIKELASLVDPTQFQPSLPAGHPFILTPEQQSAQSGEFWSATSADPGTAGRTDDA